MNLDLLKKYFNEFGVEVSYNYFGDINFKDLKDANYIYTSYEEKDGLYKSYIEDIVLGLQINNKRIIPEYKFLKAHHNKVFMEILRESIFDKKDNKLITRYFGTFEDFDKNNIQISFPIISKPSAGSKSRGVKLNNNIDELKRNVRNLSQNFRLWDYLKDKIRAIRHKNYTPNSFNKHKFILQEYIGKLEGDWKILIYGNKYYPLYRKNRKNDFRASGSGRLIFDEDINEKILEFALLIKEKLMTPILSLDIAFQDQTCYLIEFQALYFGTYTLEYSPFYFQKKNGIWSVHYEKSTLEKVYAESIYNHLIGIEN
jgi:hypothetical protein